jgi:hypothetical protein
MLSGVSGASRLYHPVVKLGNTNNEPDWVTTGKIMAPYVLTVTGGLVGLTVITQLLSNLNPANHPQSSTPSPTTQTSPAPSPQAATPFPSAQSKPSPQASPSAQPTPTSVSPKP